ncbi:CDGSH iron-sulfur domain-containing protein [Mycoplasma sp. P36-A1]|uniref:CDGSH iron-sulfur domain-containing protein n=1 Tax=Mycoplasma sp. P36-A1 TaxID=3252900 RepID=UPI003C2C1E5B
MNKNDMRVTILKDGPYLVSGDIPLFYKRIVKKGRIVDLETVKQIETNQNESYALCRCGKSKTMPFCDGSHEHAHFDGTETANRNNYLERADVLNGPEMDMYDDGRCAYARFCHRQHGDVWQETMDSYDATKKEEAYLGADLCPAGRLTASSKDGNLHEPELEPKIVIAYDKPLKISAGMWLEGYIPLYSSDGYMYELRNRYALCRCGESEIKPFCDAIHVNIEFDDKLETK